MSHLESFQRIAQKPLSISLYKERNERYLAFLSMLAQHGIDVDSKSSEVSEAFSEALTLPYPGPLYGFLRKIGVPQADARRIDDEETAHFQRLAQLGGKPHIEIAVLAELNENGEPIDNSRELAVTVICSLAGLTLATGELMKAIKSVHLAGDDVNPFDEEVARLIDSLE